MAKKDCLSGNQNQCGVAHKLETTSKQRDLDLNQACLGGASAGCSEMARFVINEGNVLIKGTDGNIYVVSKDEPLLKSPEVIQSFDQELAPSIIDAALQEVGGQIGAKLLGKLIDVAKPLAVWATDTLGLTTKNIIVAQAQRADEAVSLFDKASPANTISINGKTVIEGVNPLDSKTVKIMDSQKLTDADIMQYAQELAGNVPLREVAPGRFVANLGEGQQIRLRNVSTSQQQNGARWTVDVQGNPQINNTLGLQNPNAKVEIKFR